MPLLNPNSLSVTLGNINDALLQGPLPREGADEAAEWIASRVGEQGSYRGLPAPTGLDRRHKLRLFTGEIVGSHAGTGCKLGFEAAWALAVLKPSKASVRHLAQQCREIALALFLKEKAARRGLYCCPSCSVAGWRALGAMCGVQPVGRASPAVPRSMPSPAGGARPTESSVAGWRALGAMGKGPAEDLLEAGIARLRDLREPTGRWDKFPFWYTVLALSDLDHPAAREELRHAAKALERALSGRAKSDVASRRRRLLARNTLERQ